MPVYIGMLRGINLGPHKRMKMEKLVASCATLGFKDARTYIQSGNLVLRAPKMSAAALAKKIEQQIVADFGFSADVMIRTQDELGQIIRTNPLIKEPGIDPAKLHVGFLSSVPAASALKKLEDLTIAPDRSRPAGKEIYFYFPNGVSQSSLWKQSFDKVLGVSTTMRNWNTVNKIHELAGECE